MGAAADLARCLLKMYACVQEGLQLSQEQGSKLLAARQDLLDRLHTVAAERRTILSNVALLVLQRRPVRQRPALMLCCCMMVPWPRDLAHLLCIQLGCVLVMLVQQELCHVLL